ncbi:hypothetical protein [Streptomyces puniciscabiei]|uniref:hypothetical protein n=1 Tax=Streptomyces puniciscabiei TaxID=164348 RepID=UPI0037B4EC10
MTEYSTGWYVDSSINVHIIPRLGSRKLNSVTPILVERFLDELETDGIGRGNQVNIFRTEGADRRRRRSRARNRHDGGLRLAYRGSPGSERQQRRGGRCLQGA